jgi:hypothetical protein
MELASMLAGEEFTDRPRAVCPVIATVLRSYNDAIDDIRRQDLYRYASESVGTNDRSVRRARLREAERHFGIEPGRFKGLVTGWRLMTLARAAFLSGSSPTADQHADYLRLVDRLLAIGSSPLGLDSPARSDAIAVATSRG